MVAQAVRLEMVALEVLGVKDPLGHGPLRSPAFHGVQQLQLVAGAMVVEMYLPVRLLGQAHRANILDQVVAGAGALEK